MIVDKIWEAGLTHRWHTNPHLAGTVDRLDGHQARVARIILAFWPASSRNLIIAALTHDDGESVTGDIPWPCKKSADQIAREEAARADIWGHMNLPELTDLEMQRLKFADRLDAYLWAEHFRPDIMGRDDWQDARKWLLKESWALNIGID